MLYQLSYSAPPWRFNLISLYDIFSVLHRDLRVPWQGELRGHRHFSGVSPHPDPIRIPDEADDQQEVSLSGSGPVHPGGRRDPGCLAHEAQQRTRPSSCWSSSDRVSG